MDETPIGDFRAEPRPAVRNSSEGAGETYSSPGYDRRADRVTFDRRELNAILSVYGRMVATGEWRDYAIDWLKEAAIFSVYRRTSEVPLFRIEKRPRLKNRQGAYSVIGATGVILKRGHELSQVLRVFDKKLLRLVGD
jgi:hypothetical protein